MKNELLRIGPFTIYGYGLMIAIGNFGSLFYRRIQGKKAETAL